MDPTLQLTTLEDLQESSSSGECQFTPEELNRFEERFNHGYDIYTDKYVTWLQKIHPESMLSIEAMLGHVGGVGKLN